MQDASLSLGKRCVYLLHPVRFLQAPDSYHKRTGNGSYFHRIAIGFVFVFSTLVSPLCFESSELGLPVSRRSAVLINPEKGQGAGLGQQGHSECFSGECFMKLR